MKYNFELTDPIPLNSHPVFSSSAAPDGAASAPCNLLAWDGSSRLYFWDSPKGCFHRILPPSLLLLPLSIHKWDSLGEIYTDTQTSGLKSVSERAVNNSGLAISWLEAIFSELNDENLEEEDILTLKARPFALFDASLCLQS